LISVVNLYLKNKTNKTAGNNSISRNGRDSSEATKQSLLKKNTNSSSVNKNINSYLYSVFNRTGDTKSTDLSKYPSLKSSLTNLPLISKKPTENNLSKLHTKSQSNLPVKLLNPHGKSVENILGINPNILVSPRSNRGFSDYFNFKDKTLAEQEHPTRSVDIDSLEYKETNNTAENIFDSKKTLVDISSITRRIEPAVHEINRSKYSDAIVETGGTEISILSDAANETKVGIKSTNQSGLNQSKVIRNLKKITINLRDDKEPDSKDEFKIKLKRIETIKEENEEISKLNITLYKRQNSAFLDIKSISDATENGEHSDFIKIRLINKQNSLRVFNTKFNLSKIIDERFINNSIESEDDTVRSDSNNTIKSDFAKDEEGASGSSSGENLFPEENKFEEPVNGLSPIAKRGSMVETKSFKEVDDDVKEELQADHAVNRSNVTENNTEENDINFKPKTGDEEGSENEGNDIVQEIREQRGPKSFIRSTKRILKGDALIYDDDKRYSHIAQSDNIMNFRNSLVASGVTRRMVKSGTLDDNKITNSEKDFSSSSDSIVTASIINASTEIKQDSMFKREEKVSDFEKRKRKLKERLKFNFDKLFLNAEESLVEIKEAFKFDREIHSQINEKFKFKNKIQKRNRLIDYCKINLKYLVKDYMRTEEDKIYFNSDLFVIKRRVVLQETYNIFLKNKYLSVYKDTDMLLSREDMTRGSEITIFENFHIDNQPNFIRERRERRLTLPRQIYTSKGTFNFNKKYMNSYLRKDIEFGEDEDYIAYYSDSESSKSEKAGKFITQRQLVSVHSDDWSNSSTNYHKTLNFKMGQNGTIVAQGGNNILRTLNKQVTRTKGLISQKRDFSLLSNRSYLSRDGKDGDSKMSKKSERKLVEVRSLNTTMIDGANTSKTDIIGPLGNFKFSKQLMNRESVIYRTHEIKSEIVKSCNNNFFGVLTFHIQDKNLHKFKEVFEKGNIDVDQTDNNEDSLLIIAVKSNCYEIVEYLLCNQADVNVSDRNRDTPLHHALRNKYFTVANLLISKKADEFLSNNRGLTAWQCLYQDSESTD
jgi:hypothetical protein